MWCSGEDNWNWTTNYRLTYYHILETIMFLFHLRDEGREIKPGFNFYPLNSKSSFGCIIKIWRQSFKFRYSKVRKKWFIKRGYMTGTGLYD